MPSATPEPGESISATLSTVDDSATGIKNISYNIIVCNIYTLLHCCLQVDLTTSLSPALPLPALPLPSHPLLYKDSVSTLESLTIQKLSQWNNSLSSLTRQPLRVQYHPRLEYS